MSKGIRLPFDSDSLKGSETQGDGTCLTYGVTAVFTLQTCQLVKNHICIGSSTIHILTFGTSENLLNDNVKDLTTVPNQDILGIWINECL